MTESNQKLADEYIKSNGIKTGDASRMRLSAKAHDEMFSALESLRDSIKESSVGNEKLSKKIFHLNIILAIATVALAFFAGFEIFLKFFN